jgi:hypothetical protein
MEEESDSELDELQEFIPLYCILFFAFLIWIIA